MSEMIETESRFWNEIIKFEYSSEIGNIHRQDMIPKRMSVTLSFCPNIYIYVCTEYGNAIMATESVESLRSLLIGKTQISRDPVTNFDFQVSFNIFLICLF